MLTFILARMVLWEMWEGRAGTAWDEAWNILAVLLPSSSQSGRADDRMRMRESSARESVLRVPPSLSLTTRGWGLKGVTSRNRPRSLWYGVAYSLRVERVEGLEVEGLEVEEYTWRCS